MVIVEVPFNVFLDRNPHLKNRPLNEQSFHYHDYISQCQMQLRYMIECGGAGSSTTSEGGDVPTDTYFILQENADYVLQEDGDKLIWAI